MWFILHTLAESCIRPCLKFSELIEKKKYPLSNPQVLKEHLVDLAGRELPERMGDRYTRIVVDCLTCLDDENEFAGYRDKTTEEKVSLSVKYLEKILMKLGEIGI